MQSQAQNHKSTTKQERKKKIAILNIRSNLKLNKKTFIPDRQIRKKNEKKRKESQKFFKDETIDPITDCPCPLIFFENGQKEEMGKK